MTEWREVVLGDLCDRVTVGHVGKMSDQYVADGVPFLRSQDIRPFAVDQSGLLFIGEDFDKKLRKSALSAGDVVVVRTGYPGTAAVIPGDLGRANCADLVVITPSAGLNPHFLAAVFNSAWGKAAVDSQLVGSAQQHFNVGSAKALRIRMPSRKGQDDIASVLCSFNDLIENNRRRIELLESMARAIYREWFVYFRFPGHEAVELVDSDLGPIPEGWEVRAIGDSASLDKGLSYKGVFLTDDGAPMVNLKCVARGGGFQRHGTKPYSGPFKSKHSVNPGDIVIANTDLTQAGEVIGCPAIVPHRGFEDGGLFTHHLFAVRLHDSRLSPYLYQVFLDAPFRVYARSVASGTTVLGFRPADAAQYRLVIPSEEILTRYISVSKDAQMTVETLQDQNETLAILRDLLLPKLVTGQIDVSGLDVDAVISEAVG